MKTISGLVALGLNTPSLSDDTWNPLRANDQFQEATLIDLYFDMSELTVGVLLDLGNALQLDTGGFGLLVVRGLHTMKWNADKLERDYSAWTILSSNSRLEAGEFELVIGTWPNAFLTVAGGSAEFYEFDLGDVGAEENPLQDRVDPRSHRLRPRWSDPCEIRNYWTRGSNGADR